MGAPVVKIERQAGLEGYSLGSEYSALLSQHFCVKNEVVVLGPILKNQAIKIGCLDVNNQALLRSISTMLGHEIEAVQLNSYEIDKALKIIFHENKNKSSIENKLTLKSYEELNYDKKISAQEILNSVLGHALFLKASDIHIETYQDDMDLRYRVDGVLRDIPTPITPANRAEIISRIKVLADLDITDTRRAQDGRIVADYLGKQVSFRVAVIPGVFGEDVVIRILREELELTSIDVLGLGKTRTKKFSELLENPEGLILITGPTGSGKTTTMYTALSLLAKTGKKIITAEDPVEKNIPNVNQKQISKLMDFSDYAKAFLRQDPNVMMIGEIRDADTAGMAIRAAQNGALVLSSLHTADALRSITRMYSLGVDWDLLVNSLLAVINQRLLRKICPHCKKEYKPTEDEHLRLNLETYPGPYYIGAGCEQCFHTGYKGRVAVFEMLVMTDSIIAALKTPEDLLKVKQGLKQAGYRTIFEDAIKKARRGETSLKEIIRCIPYRIINS